MRLGHLMRRAGFYGIVAAILALFLFPIYYAFVSSMANDQGQFDPDLWPKRLDFTDYLTILRQRGFGLAMVNSVLVATAAVAGSLVLAVGAAYVLGRVRFAGRGLLLSSILAASMMPQIAVLAGMFELTRALGIYNTLGAVVLAQMAFTLPFTVWLMITFMRALPAEIEEAAIIDGAGPFILVTRIFFPMLAPAIAATGLLAFIGSWNELLFALTLTISEHVRTVPVAMSMINPYAFHEAATASIIVTIPVALLVLFFQRRIVSGLTAGAVAG